jgi:hypothetical protein
MAGGLAAPTTVRWMVRGKEEAASEIDRGCQNSIEVPVDAAEREDFEEYARVRASFGRPWILPF